jgi:hypothetical protein
MAIFLAAFLFHHGLSNILIEKIALPLYDFANHVDLRCVAAIFTQDGAGNIANGDNIADDSGILCHNVRMGAAGRKQHDE